MKIAVCDNNPDFISVITRIFENIKSEYNVDKVASYTSGQDFLDSLKNETCDAVFLDIDMPGLNGFEVARRIRQYSRRIYIIFVTADDSLAISSMEFLPFDYIIKETKSIIEKHIRHVFRKIAAQENQDKIITVKNGRNEVFLKARQIAYITNRGHYVYYHCIDQNEYRQRIFLSDALINLECPEFVRIQQYVAVNLRHIHSVSTATYSVVMSECTELLVTRSMREDFKSAYMGFLKENM